MAARRRARRLVRFPVLRPLGLFAAGFLYGITTGKSAETAARLGALAAAEVISHAGARPEQSLASRATGIA